MIFKNSLVLRKKKEVKRQWELVNSQLDFSNKFDILTRIVDNINIGSIEIEK